MDWVGYAPYLAIVGGGLYFILLFLYKDRFKGSTKISWLVQLELSLYSVSIGVVLYGIRTGILPQVILGIVSWIWFGVVIGTILLGFGLLRTGS